MKHLTPQVIAEITGGRYIGSNEDKLNKIIGAVRDNRDARTGNLFVCIKGQRVDGHDFANDAFDRGAACCLSEKELSNPKGPYVIVDSTLRQIMNIAKHYRSRFDIPFVGITGSVGKTTAKELIASVLGAKYNVLKTQMNLNNELGVPLTLLSLREHHEAAVIEMGINDFGEMRRLADMVRPDIFVMTKIGYAHIDNLGSLDGVLKAKTEAFEHMKQEAIAVMNGDDERLLNFDTKRKTIYFGLGKNNDYRAENVSFDGTNSIDLDISCTDSSYHVKIHTYGSHIPALAPAAAAVGNILGLSDEQVQRGFSDYTPVEGRSFVTKQSGITIIDDCYNANPNSVTAALTSLSSLDGRKVAILGDMLDLVDMSESKHREVGEFAARAFDSDKAARGSEAVDCGESPGGKDELICLGEQAEYIFEGYISAGGENGTYYEKMDELISNISKHIKMGDTVLIKASRGMCFEKLLPIISGLFHS